MRRTRAGLDVLGLSLVILTAAPGTIVAQSQTTAGIRGTVAREDGTPVEGATVVIRHGPTGEERVTSSRPDGRFIVVLLRPGGPYAVSVSFIGFAEVRHEEIRLQVGETYTLPITLREEPIPIEGVTARADRAEIFNPGQVGPATLLNERAVESVPILSRDVMELAALSPLVKTTESGGFSVAGQNDRYNAVLIDGVRSSDPFRAASSGVPGGQAGAKILPIDAVAQYEVLVSPFDVRLSGFAGGVMNAVTKAGSNDWYFRSFGVGRHEGLMGDLALPSGPVEASGVERSLYGFSAGGPIVRDRAHFFVATELERRRQPPAGFNLIRDDPSLVRISPEVMGTFQDLFEDSFGVETGQAGPYSLNHELANVFARIDGTVAERHRFTARTVYASATNDDAPNRSAFEPYELSSNGVLRESSSSVTSLQVFSDLGRFGANELEVSVQRSTDRTTPNSNWGQVEIDLSSQLSEDLALTRAVRAGSQLFAQDNDLEQWTYRLSNTLTLFTDRGSTFTLGVTGSYHDFRHAYLPGANGDWFFASLDDLENNAPRRYQRTVLADGEDPAVDFSVLEWGAYVQNEIDAGKGLTMRFGLRMDVPHLLTAPARNLEFEDLFGLRTDRLPSSKILISPRWGFNWQSDGRLTTQVRGGAGFFTSDLPYVWLSNAFHFNGLRSETRVCTGRWTDDEAAGNIAPRFDPVAPPSECLGGEPVTVRPVTVFDEDFKYPRYIRFSAIVDQELSERISGSLGFLFSMARTQVSVEELNLAGASGPLGSLDGYGGFDRRYYGRATDNGFEPNREVAEYDQVLLVTNRGEDWTYSFSAELRGLLTNRLAFTAGYSYARSYDKMSLTSIDMTSNIGLNATRGDPNNPLRTASNFDRPHKLVLSLYGAPIPGWERTELSLLYTGQSGLPFSYVYRGDMNGDGYPALGPAFDRNNDIIYVPNSASEVPAGDRKSVV